MKTYCYTLDLKDEPELIAEYERYHQQVWPEILQSITESGIQQMKIYRWSNRLCMIVHAADDYDPAAKAEKDAADPKVQEWEAMMDTFQKRLPFASEGQKWVPMDQIFRLGKALNS